MNSYNRIIPNSDGRTEGDNLRMMFSDEELEEMGVLEKLKKADETRKEDIEKQVDWEYPVFETKKEKEERIKKEIGSEFQVVSPDGEVITIKTGW